MDYPGIPSIPEEQEEEVLSTPSRSPVIFPEFDPGTQSPGLHSRERRDSSTTDPEVPDLPWKGILRKTRGTAATH